jgi:hypothetical protein
LHSFLFEVFNEERFNNALSFTSNIRSTAYIHHINTQACFFNPAYCSYLTISRTRNNKLKQLTSSFYPVSWSHHH